MVLEPGREDKNKNNKTKKKKTGALYTKCETRIPCFKAVGSLKTELPSDFDSSQFNSLIKHKKATAENQGRLT